MSLFKTGFSAFGKLLIVAALAGAFLVGMLGVVALSLRGEEVRVPEIVGKDFLDSEKELAQLGLKIKKRALRYSEEKPNTILEQLPRPGDTVKTGQTILVVLSQANPEGQEAPATVKKDEEETEEPSTDVAPDKPKKPTNKNADTNKRPQTTRDVVANKPKNSNVANTGGSNTSMNTAPKANTATPANRGSQPQNTRTAPTPKPSQAANRPAATGDTRTRRIP